MTRDVPTHAPQACDMNLGPRQRRRRLRLGIIGTVVLVAGAVTLLLRDAPVSYRWALTPVTLLATLGFVQYRAKT